ncbi:tape measure domain-containing protein [Pseudomonas sp. JUb42]|uniref:tape measure protein n=1 Tax=Pseudomonas sp. JUb42 TaxID=2940611 RepID=UPI00216A9E59|nr:tape measure protein [Pseudomonas sp. JUb42]MCS3467392.1 tape measure domain-containing protein [Pseudomonas sp. JUb42]
MSGNTLRSLIVSVSAETGAYQREMARAARTGQSYLRTIGDGNRQAAAGWRSQQAAINAQNAAMGSLTSTVGSYASAMLGALAVSNLLSQADSWNQVNSRLKLASLSTDDFTRSQQVLFAISQKTGTAFSDNAKLFSLSAGSMRDYGYSSQTVLQVTEALALGLQISGANAAAASSVITQFSQALAQGVLRGNDFVAVNANGDRVMRALAAGMGVARKDLKAMANEGLLTIEKIVPALVGQLGVLQQEYAAMPSSISGSMTGLSNAFQRWVGDVDGATGTTQGLSKAIGVVSENIDTLAQVAAVAGIAILARKATGVTSALIAQAAATRAAQSAEMGRARAQLDVTAILVRKTAAEVIDARAQVAAAIGTQQHAAALSRLRLARLADLQATQAHTAAQVANARASSLMGNATRGLLGLVGGPLGLGFMVAATAASFLLFRDGADKAAQASVDLQKPIQELRSEWEALGAAQQRPILAKLAQEQEQAKRAAASILADMRAIAQGPSGDYLGGSNFSANQYQRAAAAGNFGRGIKGGIDIDSATQNLINAIGTTEELQGKLEGLAAQYHTTVQRIHAAREQTSLLTSIMGSAQTAAEGLGSGLGTIRGPDASMVKSWEKRIEALNERTAKLKDPSELGEINRQAERDNLGQSAKGQQLLEQAQAAAKLADASTAAQKAQEELARKAKEAAAAVEREARQLQDNYSRTLRSLNEQVEMHGRKTELAKVEFETREGQLKQLDQAKKTELERAAIALDQLNTQKSYKDLMSDLQKQEDSLLVSTRKRYEELARLQSQGGLSADQYRAGADAISKASIAEAPKFGGLDPSVGGPIGEMIKAAEAEAELKAWNEKQLAMQAELHAQKLSSEQEYLDRVAEIHEINQQKLSDIQGSYKVAMFSTFSELAGNAAEMVGKIAGEQSGAYKVLFMAQKAFAVASIIMNAQIAAAKAPAELTVLGGIPVGAAILAAGYANAGMVAGMTLAGMAHDGIDSIPKEGTWLLQKGERVVDGRTNRDLKQFLSKTPEAANQGETAPQIHITINGDGSDGTVDSTQGYEAMGHALLATVRAEMPKIARGVIISEKGQNGLLDPNNRRAG